MHEPLLNILAALGNLRRRRDEADTPRTAATLREAGGSWEKQEVKRTP